jgi:hypothetical protein
MPQASYQTGRNTTAGRVANKSAMATLPCGVALVPWLASSWGRRR